MEVLFSSKINLSDFPYITVNIESLQEHCFDA